jgi:hypothetical protein
MAVTTTSIGHIGGSGSTLVNILPSYNQAAGNCIVVAGGTYTGAGNDFSTPTDTAGNTYALALGPITVGNANVRFYYAKNCLGNASNVITAHYNVSNQFCSIFAWDVAGVDLSNPIDVTASASGTSNSPSVTISTLYANEAVIAFNEIGSGYSTASAGTGFTLDGNDGSGGNEGAGEHEVFTSVQMGIPVGMSLSTAPPWILGVVSFAATGGVDRVAADNFTRANSGTLGANWTTPINGSAVQIVSNRAEGTITSLTMAYWNAYPWLADQYSEITTDASTFTASNSWDSYQFAWVRVSNGAVGANGYAVLIGKELGSYAYYFNKIVNGTRTGLAGPVAITYTPGDVFRFSAVGSVMTLYQNGVFVASFTDTTFFSGSPGIGFIVNHAITDTTMPSWAGGVYAAGSATASKIIHVQQFGTNNGGGTGVTSPSVTVTKGNLLVATLLSYNVPLGTTATASDTLGNSWAAAVGPLIDPIAAQPRALLYMFYAKNLNATGSTAVTITLSGTGASSSNRLFCHEVSGLDKFSPLDQTNSNAATGPAITSGNVTTAFANEFLYGFVGDNNGNPTIGNGWIKGITEVLEYDEWQIVSVTGTLAATYTGAAATYVAAIATFKAAAALGGRMLMGVGT